MINLKLRLQNKVTLVALFGAVILMFQQFGFEIPQNIQAGVNTLIYILVLLGIVNDPTTPGLSDGVKSTELEKPSEEVIDEKE